MTPEELSSLFSNRAELLERNFAPDEAIFRQGDEANYIYGIISGRVQLVRITSEGRPLVMFTATANETFAEAALFSPIYHCDAISSDNTKIIFFPKKPLLDLLQSSPDAARQLIALLARQVRDLRTRLELRNILSAKDRILHFLYMNASPLTGSLILQAPLKELAAELGLAHETLYRELAKLEKENIIQRRENEIILINRDTI